MNCDDSRLLLHPYLDRELDPSRSLEVEAHIRGCRGCDAELANYRALSSTIRSTAQYFTAPDELRSRITAAMGGSEPKRNSHARMAPQRWQLLAGSVAAALVVSLALNTLLNRQSTVNLIAQEVVSSHARSLMANHLVDVVSSDRHTVKPWLDKNLDFAATVEDFAPRGFALVGGRLDYLDHHQVAALVYRHRQHVVNVFIWPTPTTADSSPTWLTRQGYNLAYWTESGMNYWVISDADRAGLNALVGMVRGATSPSSK